MKKKLIIAWTMFIALVFLPSTAFTWGSATHAYLDDHIGKREELRNLNEIYGGMANDVFNYMFNYPAYMGYLYYQTHNEFLRVWGIARTRQGKSLAYGFVSHNDVWGADFTAHHSGLTFGQDKGYIIAKAYILKSILEQVPEYQALQLPDQVALEVSHNLVESGVDLLIKRRDSMIGLKVAASAILRSPELPFFMVKAYAEEFSDYANISYLEAAKIIASTETDFRKRMILYGQALMQDEATAIQLISEDWAELAIGFFAMYGITLPEGTDLTPLIKFAIGQAMEICKGDFDEEVEATINFVNQQLLLYRIIY